MKARLCDICILEGRISKAEYSVRTIARGKILEVCSLHTKEGLAKSKSFVREGDLNEFLLSVNNKINTLLTKEVLKA